MFKCTFFLLTFISCFIFTTNQLKAQESLFYIQDKVLYRYTLPSGPEVSKNLGAGSDVNSNDDLVLNEMTQKLYWIDQTNLKSIPADFDASSTITTEFGLTTGANVLGARGISIDETNNNLYIGEEWTINFFEFYHNVARYDLDNANPISTRTVLHTFGPSSVGISSTEVDVANNRIYWAQLNTEIGYVDLLGNNPTQLVALAGSSLNSIEKDPTSERIVYTAGNSVNTGTIGAVSTVNGSTTTLYTDSGNGSTTILYFRAIGIADNGDLYFMRTYLINFGSPVQANLLKGNIGTAPITTSTVTGPAYSSSSQLYLLTVGTVASQVPEVTISATTSTSVENTGSNLVYQFSRTGDTSGSLAVNFSVSGTTLDSDFSVVLGGTGSVTYDAGTNKGTITFPASSATVNLEIDPAGDNIVEGSETVIVTVDPSS